MWIFEYLTVQAQMSDEAALQGEPAALFHLHNIVRAHYDYVSEKSDFFSPDTFSVDLER